MNYKFSLKTEYYYLFYLLKLVKLCELFINDSKLPFKLNVSESI